MKAFFASLMGWLADAFAHAAADDREGARQEASVDELRDALERRIAEDEGRDHG